MNFKKIATTIELLAITSVISVGFSVWTIVETTFPTVTATIETENVINNNDYLDIKNVYFSDYCETGFYQDFVFSSIDSNKAKLYVDIDINLTRWNELIESKSYTYLYFTIDLELSLYTSFFGSCKSAHLNEFITSSTISENSTWTDNIVVLYSSVSNMTSFTLNLIYEFNNINWSSLSTSIFCSSFKDFTFTVLAEMSGGN